MPEAVTSGAVTQIVELVEIGVLAERHADAARQERALDLLVPSDLPSAGHHGIGGIEPLVREPRQVVREAGAAPQLQAPHLGIGEQPVRGHLAAQAVQLREVAGVPPPCAGDRPQPPAVAGEHRHQQLAQGQERRLGQHPDQMEPRVALQHDTQLVAALEPLQCHPHAVHLDAVHRQGQRAARHRFAMTHPRLGRHHDA